MTLPHLALSRGYYRQAILWRTYPHFDEAERDYKLVLAGALTDAKRRLDSGASSWRLALVAALRLKQNNIIHWQHAARLHSFILDGGRTSAEAFERLWSRSGPVSSRINQFAEFLDPIGLSQIGSKLTIASTLLMAVGGRSHPPIRTEPFRGFFFDAGLDGFLESKTPGLRYDLCIAALDAFLTQGPSHGLFLRDRLDAQSIVWCLKDHEDPPATGLRTRIGKPTKRQALIEARRGQGQFRDDLLEYWGACAVTGCVEPSLLRASHLKPWKDSSDEERLDPSNGLLLSPTLDCAVDRHLISFSDTGKVLYSPRLTPTDRKALTLEAGLALRVTPTLRQLKYIRIHRAHMLALDHA